MNDEWRGKVGALERDEVDEFLGEGRIAGLAVRTARAGRTSFPCGMSGTRARSGSWPASGRCGRGTSRDGRCSLAIDEDGRQRKVLAQCRATVVEEPCLDGEWVPVAERMSIRYLGENGPKYLVPTMDKPRWLIRLDPVKLQTWQGNDWASRYK